MNDVAQLSARAWSHIFIILGVALGLITLLLLRERGAQERVIEGLAKLGPCTGLDLVKAGYAQRGTVYVVLGALEERGLVRGRSLALTPSHLAVRGDIPLREFRLTTKGWSYATILTK